MSYVSIRSIAIRSDGVYLCSKSSNDDLPYRLWKSDSLTMTYENEGQTGLDREIITMLWEYAQIQGRHPSITRYLPCLSGAEEIHKKLIINLNAEYAKLSPKDKTTVLLRVEQQTAGARVYNEYASAAKHEFYTQLSKLIEAPANTV